MDFQEFASNSFGNDIDVYLQPIMEELKELLGVGGKTYDPALAMLSRQSTKRQLELRRKKYLRIKRHPEGCLMDRIIEEDLLHLTSRYLNYAETQPAKAMEESCMTALD